MQVRATRLGQAHKLMIGPGLNLDMPRRVLLPHKTILLECHHSQHVFSLVISQLKHPKKRNSNNPLPPVVKFKLTLQQ